MRNTRIKRISPILGIGTIKPDGLDLRAVTSVRRLVHGYAGACMRVRRSSDNAEADIGFTAGGDLDEVALLAHTGADDGFVRTWYDQSGLGNNGNQPTTTRQVQIVAEGTVLKKNDRPALRSNVGNVVAFSFSSLDWGYLSTVISVESFVNASRLFQSPDANNCILMNASGVLSFRVAAASEAALTLTAGEAFTLGTSRLLTRRSYSGTPLGDSSLAGSFGVLNALGTSGTGTTPDAYYQELVLTKTLPELADTQALTNNQKLYFSIT
jgi:hypothetical protein